MSHFHTEREKVKLVRRRRANIVGWHLEKRGVLTRVPSCSLGAAREINRNTHQALENISRSMAPLSGSVSYRVPKPKLGSEGLEFLAGYHEGWLTLSVYDH